MSPSAFPFWTLFPFGILIFAIASLPILLPGAWGRHWFQGLVVLSCSGPVVVYLLTHGHTHHLLSSAESYLSFVATIGALYIVASGVFVSGDIEATPLANVGLVLLGSICASVIGTTGASMLFIRPLLRTNSQREHRQHIVPFFILTVANAGGLLTPLGDPPLLLGYLQGVPFLWTLRLAPYWVLYVGGSLAALYFIDRRAYARESPEAIRRDKAEAVPFLVQGRHNLALLLTIVGAVLLPAGFREAAIVGIACLSYFATSRDLHEKNGFSFGPIVEVAILFSGLFACLVPFEVGLAAIAPTLPIQKGWQLFWCSGALSAILDNAPTYAAFAALARGLGSHGADLVAGIDPIKLAGLSVGSVVMGATTYIGNGPNLMVKAIAERAKYRMPSFPRYAIFAFAAMLPAHVVTTLALSLLEK